MDELNTPRERMHVAVLEKNYLFITPTDKVQIHYNYLNKKSQKASNNTLSCTKLTQAFDNQHNKIRSQMVINKNSI